MSAAHSGIRLALREHWTFYIWSYRRLRRKGAHQPACLIYVSLSVTADMRVIEKRWEIEPKHVYSWFEINTTAPAFSYGFSKRANPWGITQQKWIRPKRRSVIEKLIQIVFKKDQSNMNQPQADKWSSFEGFLLEDIWCYWTLALPLT